jgi:hypothetical protein
MTTDEFVDFLEHHGVRGMHWGVRREQMRVSSVSKRGAKEVQRRTMRPASPIRATPTIGRSSFTKSKVKTVGGEDHPPHEDAVKVAIARQKMKRSGVVALSNTELQTMAQRMNLESQVHSLNARRPRSIGRGFADAHLKKAMKDPYGTAVGAHRLAKNVKRATKVGALALAV